MGAAERFYKDAPFKRNLLDAPIARVTIGAAASSPSLDSPTASRPGFAERGGENLDDPEAERDLRNFAGVLLRNRCHVAC